MLTLLSHVRARLQKQCYSNQAMMSFFNKTHCKECDTAYDSAAQECPECGSRNSIPESLSFKNMTPLGPIKELIVFFVGWLGFQILAFLIQSIYLSFFTATNGPFPDIESLTTAFQNYLNNGAIGPIFFITYGALFVIMALIIWKDWPRLVKRFSIGLSYYGVLIGIAVILFDILWGVVVTQCGFSSNQNQQNVSKIATSYPFLSILMIGIIGPFCEEMAYRVGLFGVLKRVNTYVAYIVGSLIFAFIHFDLTQIGSASEWINFPPYFISGLALSFAYDRFGLAGSLFAHWTNNIYAMIGIIATQGK